MLGVGLSEALPPLLQCCPTGPPRKATRHINRSGEAYATWSLLPCEPSLRRSGPFD